MNRCFLYLLFLLVSVSLQAQTFTEKEVSIATNDPAITLAGTLSVPKSKGKHPAVLLVVGNGPHTRDDSISGTPVFKQLADWLVSQDMVVLRVDKRGFGKSTGPKTESEGNYTTRDLVNDFKAAYAFLNKQSSVDTSKVGLIGHSEGAIITSMMAAEISSIDWVVIAGSPAVQGDSIVAAQKRWNRAQLGMPAEISAAVGKVWNRYAAFIKDGYADDSLYYSIGRDFLIAHGLNKDDKRITNKFINQLLDGYKTPWYQYFFSLDPADYLQQIHIPLLAVFGGHDDQVTVKQNLPPMQAALEKSGNDQYRIVVLADEDHFFLRHNDKRMPKHRYGEMKLSNRLLNVLDAWLREMRIVKNKK